MTKRDKYFYKLLYWSEEAIKKEHCFMAPVPLDMETPNLVKTTLRLLKTKFNNLELDKNLHIISDVYYTEMLKKLNLIKVYLDNRKKNLMKAGLM